ncbi:MAG: RNA-binding domain-containing protein [Thermoplasmatota archaeon]
MSEARPIRVSYHWLRLRAVAHPTEDPAKVQQALRFVSGLDEAGFQDAVRATQLETHHGLPLTVFEAVLDRSRDLRAVLARVFALPGALDRLRATLDARVDDDGILYLRVEKQAASLGELRLGEGEDAIQIRLKVEAYPAGRAAALERLRTMLESGRP